MNCFVHNENVAVGICKACQKAVCLTCAIDTGRGLVCSNKCQSEVTELNEIEDKSKRIYGIGSSHKLLPTGILLYLFFGIAFAGFGIFKILDKGKPDFFLFVMGGGFLLIGFIAWLRNRKLNINC